MEIMDGNLRIINLKKEAKEIKMDWTYVEELQQRIKGLIQIIDNHNKQLEEYGEELGGVKNLKLEELIASHRRLREEAIKIRKLLKNEEKASLKERLTAWRRNQK